MPDDVIIFGSGPIGLSCAFQLGIRGIRSRIFESLHEIGGQCLLYPKKHIHNINNFPHMSAENLVQLLKDQADVFEPNFHMNEEIISIKKIDGIWEVKSVKGKIYKTYNIVVACGFGKLEPRKIPLNHHLKNILYHIENPGLFKDKTVAIAGGGNTATDWAFEITKFAKMVYLIHRKESFRCPLESLERLKKHPKIKILTPYSIEKVSGTDNLLQTITLKNIENNEIEEIECEFLCPFLGFKSEIGPIKQWDLLNPKNFISVNPNFMTTAKTNIFAIGDIADYPQKERILNFGFLEAEKAAISICFK